MDEQHGQAQAEGQHDADGRVPFPRPLPQDAEKDCRQGTSDQGAEADVEPGQQRERGAGQG